MNQIKGIPNIYFADVGKIFVNKDTNELLGKVFYPFRSHKYPNGGILSVDDDISCYKEVDEEVFLHSLNC